jgi:hypothetical protein
MDLRIKVIANAKSEYILQYIIVLSHIAKNAGLSLARAPSEGATAVVQQHGASSDDDENAKLRVQTKAQSHACTLGTLRRNVMRPVKGNACGLQVSSW